MLIQIEFAKSFETVAKGEKKSVDIDWQETIENLKVLITCNIDKLAASDFELYYKGKKSRMMRKSVQLAMCKAHR